MNDVSIKKSAVNLNSYLLRQAAACPLKLQYILDPSIQKNSGIPYKYQLMIMMRRVLSLLFPGGKEAGHHHQEAIGQTTEWLKEREAVIYGGVIAWKNFHARFPVMSRSGNHLKLYQLHGKLWKYSSTNLLDHLSESEQLMAYAREAAYKRWLVRNIHPDLDISLRICFPNPDYISDSPNLFEEIAFGESVRERVSKLFVEVDADSAADSAMEYEPSGDIHPLYIDKNLEEQLLLLRDVAEARSGDIPFVATGSCRNCQFRSSSGRSGKKGCWEKNLNGNYLNPDRHLFDLVGQGNQLEAKRENHLQEEVPLPAGVDSFESVRFSATSRISIQQRRSLQLLSSRNRNLPLQWMKKGLTSCLGTVLYPLHFLDFEAASNPVPMAKATRPYSPVLFQFSCHTLYEDGRLNHHHWLDCDMRGFPHRELAEKLTAVPDIERGTIMQYSPFEKQALGKLYRDISQKQKISGNDELPGKLKAVLAGCHPGQRNRFLDLNRLTRDYYYNRRMNDGLSLKKVLYSTLNTSGFLQSRYEAPIHFEGEEIQIVKSEGDCFADPYMLVQNSGMNITDGPAAMYAWLHSKTPYCDEEERRKIQTALKKYCMLDTLALVMIFQHWSSLMEKYPADRDIIVWEE